MNDVRKIETVMTYDQWKEEYKKRLRKRIKNKLERILYRIALDCIFLLFPVLMFVHYFLIGY